MDININELFSNAVEERARELAAEMMAAQKKPQIEPIIAQNGEYVTPHFFFGERYLSTKQVEALLGVKYPALWKWQKEGKLSRKKIGGRLLYRLDDVKQIALNA